MGFVMNGAIIIINGIANLTFIGKLHDSKAGNLTSILTKWQRQKNFSLMTAVFDASLNH